MRILIDGEVANEPILRLRLRRSGRACVELEAESTLVPGTWHSIATVSGEGVDGATVYVSGAQYLRDNLGLCLK